MMMYQNAMSQQQAKTIYLMTTGRHFQCMMAKAMHPRCHQRRPVAVRDQVVFLANCGIGIRKIHRLIILLFLQTMEHDKFRNSLLRSVTYLLNSIYDLKITRTQGKSQNMNSSNNTIESEFDFEMAMSQRHKKN